MRFTSWFTNMHFVIKISSIPKIWPFLIIFLRRKSWKKFMVIVGKIWKTDGSVSSQGLSISLGYFTPIDAISFFWNKNHIQMKKSFCETPAWICTHWLVHTASKCFFSFFLAILFAIRMLLLTQGLLSICYWVFTEYYSAYSFAKSTQWRREKMIMMDLTEMFEC